MWLKAVLSARTMLSARGRASLLRPHPAVALLALKPQQILVKHTDFSPLISAGGQHRTGRLRSDAHIPQAPGLRFCLLLWHSSLLNLPRPSAWVSPPAPGHRGAAPAALPVQPRFCPERLITWRDERVENARQMGFGWLCGEQKCF